MIHSDLDNAWYSLGVHIRQKFEDRELDERVRIEIASILYHWYWFNENDEFKGSTSKTLMRIVLFHRTAIRDVSNGEYGNKALLEVFGEVSRAYLDIE